MGVGDGLYMYDVVVKSSRSLSPLLVSSCYHLLKQLCFMCPPFCCKRYSRRRHHSLVT